MRKFILLVLFLSSCNFDNTNNLVITEEDSVEVILQIEDELRITEFILPSENKKGKIINLNYGCGYDKGISEDIIYIWDPRPREVDVINKILSYSGLPSNFKVYSSDIFNAAAVMIDNERFIIYDPALLKNVDQFSKTYWSSISILAHEIGHHLSGHTLAINYDNAHEQELEADKFSGFILYKMGASEQEAISAMLLYGSDYNSLTHPKKKLRIAKISEGWQEAAGYRYNSAIPPPPAKEIPYKIVFDASTFFESEDFYETDFYDRHKHSIDDTTIYEAIILEIDPKHIGVGDPEPAILMYIDGFYKKGKYPNFSKGDKKWICYNYPFYGELSNAESSWFETILTPGQRVRFSSVWEGGTQVGYYQLYHLENVLTN